MLNKGLSINIRSINLILSKLFQKYATTLNKIERGGLTGFSQTRRLQDKYNIPVQYQKGEIVVRNNIDSLTFLLSHREEVANSIGVGASEIFDNRRNMIKVSEYLSKMNGTYDIGRYGDTMQLYISRQDENIGSMDSQKSWIDYVLTQTWIDKLA